MQIEQDDKFIHDRFGNVIVSSVVEVYRSYDQSVEQDPDDVVVRFKDATDEWNPRAAPPWSKSIDRFLDKADPVES
jgi:hypothetical protein